jgi:hypothetical protein
MVRTVDLHTSARERCRAGIVLCLTLCIVALTLAEEANIPPSVTGYLEELDDGTPSYSRSTGVMRYGRFSSPPGVGTDHAFLKFSLDSLPDSITITSADLNYYQYEHTGGLPVVDIRLIRDPIAQPPHDAFYGILNGRVLTTSAAFPDGWISRPLDSIAGPLLDSCLRVGVASLAIHWSGPAADTYRASAYGYDSSSAPYLHLVYRPAGIGEAQRMPGIRPVFALTPNPTRSAYVTINTDIAVLAGLTLSDVLGRPVRSGQLTISGRPQLDLRGLSSGVYMATLDAGTQSLTRKLVVTGR